MNFVTSSPVILRNDRFRRDPRQIDEDEELWFNNDDDECDDEDSSHENARMLRFKFQAQFDQYNKKTSEKKSNLGRF